MYSCNFIALIVLHCFRSVYCCYYYCTLQCLQYHSIYIGILSHYLQNHSFQSIFHIIFYKIKQKKVLLSTKIMTLLILLHQFF